MWTQRDQFSNKQLTFIDDHLNIRLYKQCLSNQPHMQQGVFKVHLAANSLRSNSLVSIPVMHFVIPCQSSSKFRPWCNLCFSLSAISASYTTTLCLTYRKYHGQSIYSLSLCHSIIPSLLWRKQSHQRNVLFLTNEDTRVSDVFLCILQII